MEDSKKRLIKRDIVFIFLIIIMVVGCVRKELQNDTFFSIAVGRQILDTGIDMCEHLAWHEGYVYTYTHWILDLINLLLYNLGGFNLIYIATIIGTIEIGVILYFVLTKISKDKTHFIPFIITIFIIYLANSFYTARAQMVTYILFILEVYFIEKLLETNKKKYAFFLILIPIIIANFHASLWPLYFIFYIPYILEEIVYFASTRGTAKREISKLAKKLKTEDNEEYRERIKKLNNIIEEDEKKDKKIYIEKQKYIKTLVLVMIIALFTGLLTPLGDTPYTYIIKTMSGISSKYINELFPVNLKYDANFLVFIIILILLLVSKKTKMNCSDLVLICILIAMAINNRRSIAYLLFIGSFVLLKLIDQFGIIDDRKINRKFYFFVIIITLIVSAELYFEINLNSEIVSEEEYPVDACEFILNNLDIDNMRIYNGFNYGSYMEFKGIPVFIDSRSEVYTEEYNDTTVFQDYMDIENGVKSYKEIFEKYDITHVLVPSNDIVQQYIVYDEEYNLIYSDNYFVLYEKL